MSSLSVTEMPLFESLFGMSSGYVLDFSDRTFNNFIQNSVGIDITQAKFIVNGGTSKAKRLRQFWQLESDQSVGKLLLALIDYYENINLASGKEIEQVHLVQKCRAIASRLSGKNIVNEEDLLNYEFKTLPIEKLAIEGTIISILKQRIDEIKSCLKIGASLSVIFLCGSLLEGILLGIASNNTKSFNQSKASPKDKETGTALSFHRWTLNDFINVSCDIGLIDLNVKTFSHNVRDFRNYIHPYTQLASGFTPDKHTAEISWKVLQLVIFQLTKTKY